MTWTSTPESSNVAGFGYEEVNHVLVVEFKNGARYNYYDVPDAIYQQMTTASSKGQFLAQNIKGIYRYART